MANGLEPKKLPQITYDDAWKVMFTEAAALSVLLLADTDATVVKANKALCRATGYTDEELTGNPWRNYVATSDARKFSVAIQKLIQDEKGSQSIDGFQLWVCKSESRPPLGVNVLGFRLPPLGGASYILLQGIVKPELPLLRKDSTFGKLVDSMILNPKPWGVAAGYVVTALVAVFAPSIFQLFTAAVKGSPE